MIVYISFDDSGQARYVWSCQCFDKTVCLMNSRPLTYPLLFSSGNDLDLGVHLVIKPNPKLFDIGGYPHTLTEVMARKIQDFMLINFR